MEARYGGTDRRSATARGYNFKWGHRVTPEPQDAAKVYITTFGGSVWHGPADGAWNFHVPHR